jgi:hypothetical protein
MARHALDLHSASLFATDLFRANLSGANLSGANLSGADLFGTNLDHAKYDGGTKFPDGLAPLRSAWLRSHCLHGTKVLHCRNEVRSLAGCHRHENIALDARLGFFLCALRVDQPKDRGVNGDDLSQR